MYKPSKGSEEMRKIISLPPSLVGRFNELTSLPREEWHATTDPHNCKVGSGGGTAWALYDEERTLGKSNKKRIVIHAGGQSRRLPSYAPSGKVLAPIPIFRWSRGQSVEQNLLSIQTPLYERIMESTSDDQNTLIASGDMLIHAPKLPSFTPQADVVCFGIWASPQLATNHGVFFTRRDKNGELDFMLQKPTHAQIEELSQTHLYLMDIGIWILSDRAVDVLMKKCGWNGERFENDVPTFYDLYSEYGISLGKNPTKNDDNISSLSVEIVTLEDGEFYHYGTSPELISSTDSIQNKVIDQRNIWQKKIKPQSSIFVLNSDCNYQFESYNRNIWIENSTVSNTWKLSSDHIITGVPDNNWNIDLPQGLCIDIIPLSKGRYAVRTYHINDKFSGSLTHYNTMYMGMAFTEWLHNKKITLEEAMLDGSTDIQQAKLFPVVSCHEAIMPILRWLIDGSGSASNWLDNDRLSADEISEQAELSILFEQRNRHLKKDVSLMAKNHKKSIFYQTDLKLLAKYFNDNDIPLPTELSEDEAPMVRMRDQMFRSEVLRKKDKGKTEANRAFKILQQSIINTLDAKANPRCTIYTDQIVWGRSPARLDIAGGWSDTPPYCLQEGGSVVNIAIELNGQPPIQCYIRLAKERSIVMRSIDNGVMERVTTYDELAGYNNVGSAFCIPKAALCLAGFHPDFCTRHYSSLQEQLNQLGGGLEITLLVAIPKGSGLGTSSILAATILGSLSDFCGLGWTKQQICHRTLILEQLLTTGGGWQDQYGGIFAGVKLCESEAGGQNNIAVKWLPEHLFSNNEYQSRWLLYYTGITRVAKNILDEIVRGMFLNEAKRISVVDAIKNHSYAMAEAIQRSDYNEVGKLMRRSWRLNCQLDPGTTTPEIESITQKIDHLALGYKLLGAGGGGYMLICAKDGESAITIRSILNQNPPNDRARFVEMKVSGSGLQISRS
jgi:galactokinase/mevalonate kinase-like predicted kinase